MALDMVRWELDRAGVVLRLPAPDGAFCVAPNDTEQAQIVLDAAFIDDEALGLVARSAQLLDKGIDALLGTVYDVFECLHLLINAAPGKTECLVQYRGEGAVACREARRDDHGKLRLKVPHREVAIDVVESYKHLGTFTTLRPCSLANTKHRTAETWKAYAPISWKVFGSQLVTTQHKLLCARTLLLTRLLFGLYVLVPSPRQLKVMNAVYMVILRRIADEPRCKRVEHTDRQLRELLDQPAIECLIARMRLLYCARLERVRPSALMAILPARPKGRCLPWVRQLASGTDLLRDQLPPDFPSLLEDPEAWRTLMPDDHGWKSLIYRVHFIESVCDIVIVLLLLSELLRTSASVANLLPRRKH